MADGGIGVSPLSRTTGRWSRNKVVRSLPRSHEIAPGSTLDVASRRVAYRRIPMAKLKPPGTRTLLLALPSFSLSSPCVSYSSSYFFLFSALATANIFRSDSPGEACVCATCRGSSAASAPRGECPPLPPPPPPPPSSPPRDVPLTVTISSTYPARHLASKHVWPLALSRKGLPLSRYSC